ncbi:MAG: hypothetical protein IJ333_10010, partial [Clostridia bacterium]|nr:hypothetical protein [Clostridia bacterium]
MKKYRCPHCGKETINYKDFFFAFQHSRGSSEFFEDKMGGIVCSYCSGRCIPIGSFKPIDLYIYLLLMAVILFLILFKNPWYIVLGILWHLLSVFLIFPLINHGSSVVVYDPKEHRKVIPAANALVELEKNVQIKKYMIYGLEIKKKALNARFHNHFKDGMIPAMFLERTDKHKFLWRVYIIDRAIVPDEL